MAIVPIDVDDVELDGVVVVAIGTIVIVDEVVLAVIGTIGSIVIVFV